jgi:hypothetical protein
MPSELTTVGQQRFFVQCVSCPNQLFPSTYKLGGFEATQIPATADPYTKGPRGRHRSMYVGYLQNYRQAVAGPALLDK